MSDEELINEVEAEGSPGPAEDSKEADAAKDPEGVEESAEGKPKKKRGLRFKILMVVVIVVAVLGIAGTAVYLIFHDDPAFCAAICHDPMDPYLLSYTEGISVNELQQDSNVPLELTEHITYTNDDPDLDTIVCVDCHTDGLDTQIVEGFAWVSGSFQGRNTKTSAVNTDKDLTNDVNPNHKTSVQLHLGSTQDVGDRYGVEFCLQPGCHVDDNGNPIEDARALQDAKAADQTAGGVNPHLMTVPGTIDSQQHATHYVEGGLLDCSNCHQVHEQSVNLCTLCHADGLVAEARIAELPEGWLTYQQYVMQKNQAAE